MFYLDNQSEKMNNWHILLQFRQIKLLSVKLPNLGGQFVCSFKSNSKHTLLCLYGHNVLEKNAPYKATP